MNNNNQIAGAVIIAGVLIAGAVLLKGSQKIDIPSQNGNSLTDLKIKPIDKEEHILGNINSKVVIIEYSDTECPFCKVFHKTMQQVVEKNNGKVAWVYRHYPIAQLHPKAFHEAEATECAWEQGGNKQFWNYIDQIYARTTSNNNLNVAELPNIAKDIGLDTAVFNECLESGKYKNKIENSITDANAMKVAGTPYSLILVDGKVVDDIQGAQPIEIVMQKINNVLK